jgi:hypothetical protein
MATRSAASQPSGLKNQNVEVTLLAPQQGFRRYLRFNRFRADRIDGGRLLQVSFVGETGLDLCRYASFLSRSDLSNNSRQVGKYIGALGVTPSPSTKWD